MIDGTLWYLVVATAVACGLMGGAFYAFSSFVMAGLDRLAPEQGMAAMQSINVTAVGPGFMVGFFGTALASVAVAASALVNWDPATSSWLLAGAALYLVGTFGLTAAYHVPRNDRLAATNPTEPGAERLWARYLKDWTRWNHLRMASSVAAAAALTVATRLG